MKDKRTYTNAKEHGEDMSHENETKIKHEPKEDRGSLDLTFLIEQHKKEIWDWKQKESEWVKTDNMFKGSKKIIDELSSKLIQQIRIISDLNNQITKLKKELADKNK
jgi:predicted RNase H-like nuclease (RuvC/YqgF family)|tara:strand:- start:64 stop:384 length:321 start_codon:yes stop_codon:yes gene_type:complete